MKIVGAHNTRNESEIEFVTSEVNSHESPAAFYARAIHELFRGSDPDACIDTYVSSGRQISRSAAELRSRIAELLEITPVLGFTPALDEVSAAWSFRTEWNAEEHVWCSGQNYWLVCWGTSA